MVVYVKYSVGCQLYVSVATCGRPVPHSSTPHACHCCHSYGHSHSRRKNRIVHQIKLHGITLGFRRPMPPRCRHQRSHAVPTDGVHVRGILQRVHIRRNFQEARKFATASATHARAVQTRMAAEGMQRCPQRALLMNRATLNAGVLWCKLHHRGLQNRRQQKKEDKLASYTHPAHHDTYTNLHGHACKLAC